jgi:pimeloyl-ACP methyl ester carboxylesterase
MKTAGYSSTHEALRANLDKAVEMAHLSTPEPEALITGNSRRRALTDPRAASRLATAALVDDDGILRWEYDPPPISSRRRARRSGLAGHPDVVHSFQFEEAPPNKFTELLQRLDDDLTRDRGLRQWKNGLAVPITNPSFKGPVLLLIHGTFSKGDMFIQEFSEAPNGVGTEFLQAAEKKYEAVLTFDHPTLSVGPWLNALDLAVAMKDIRGPIDVICHSRGGLVASWWLFHAAPKARKIIFVGSPLAGTSLASPARLKAALDLLGNFARALGNIANATATVVPMLAIAGGLFKIVGGVLSFGANTTLLDAGVNLVPGLASQSHVGNNLEMERLFATPWAAKLDMYSVTSDYEPPQNAEPWWKFWSQFSKLPANLANSAADMIFDGPNDLVVDFPSMCQFGKTVLPTGLTFTRIQSVHHCAYFRNRDTVNFFRKTLL